MAHESFEDPATAEVMNRLFVNVKVDRVTVAVPRRLSSQFTSRHFRDVADDFGNTLSRTASWHPRRRGRLP